MTRLAVFMQDVDVKYIDPTYLIRVRQPIWTAAAPVALHAGATCGWSCMRQSGAIEISCCCQSESFHMRAGAAGCAHKLYGPHLLQGGALVPAASHATAVCCPLLTPPHVDSTRPGRGARRVCGLHRVHGRPAEHALCVPAHPRHHPGALASALLSLAACSVAGCSSPLCAVWHAEKPRISRATRLTGQLVGAVLKALCRVIALQRCLPHPK